MGFGKELQMLPWSCPMGCKKVVKPSSKAPFTSILTEHMKGKMHRKKVGQHFCLDGRTTHELAGIRTLQFTMKGWTYYFNPISGAQGWHAKDAELEPREVEFLRPEWWGTDDSSLAIARGCFSNNER